MGTNYYLHSKPDCECCGRPAEPLHIGKCSGGWCFALHVIPAEALNRLDDWITAWNAEDAVIMDEYGRHISRDAMIQTITNRWPGGGESRRIRWAGFYSTEQEFLEKNNAEWGPNNLLRRKIELNCIGHGEGTWDHIEGEFS